MLGKFFQTITKDTFSKNAFNASCREMLRDTGITGLEELNILCPGAGTFLSFRNFIEALQESCPNAKVFNIQCVDIATTPEERLKVIAAEIEHLQAERRIKISCQYRIAEINSVLREEEKGSATYHIVYLEHPEISQAFIWHSRALMREMYAALPLRLEPNSVVITRGYKILGEISEAKILQNYTLRPASGGSVDIKSANDFVAARPAINNTTADIKTITNKRGIMVRESDGHSRDGYRISTAALLFMIFDFFFLKPNRMRCTPMAATAGLVGQYIFSKEYGSQNYSERQTSKLLTAFMIFCTLALDYVILPQVLSSTPQLSR